MHSVNDYCLVKLPNGVHSVRSIIHHETFHPVIGPAAEADVLCVRQLGLIERLGRYSGEFVVWDVGLGAAGNALGVIRATQHLACAIRLISFDQTLAPLEFGLAHATELGYLHGYEQTAKQLIARHRVDFTAGRQTVNWELHLGDFPALLAQPAALALPKPHVILFDPFSPPANPAMWTQHLFTGLFRLLDPGRPCALATYSRSTMLRVTLLLAGFYVGVGHGTGEKEETTVAANTLRLIAVPLSRKWLSSVRRSTSAEPLFEPVYRQGRLSSATWERLQDHPQFQQADPVH